MYELMEEYDLASNGSLFCNDTRDNLTSISVPSIYTTMISSIASMLGSSLIILTFVCWPDLRTVARAILVFLAIADFLTAAGYLLGSIIFLVDHYDYSNDYYYHSQPALCTLQSFITSTFIISSFIWTANLAVYLFVAITLKKIQLAKKLVLLFHITAWGIPLLICIPGAAFGILGQTGPTQGTVAWCWVSFDDTYTNTTDITEAKQRITYLHTWELLYGKFWEITICVFSFVLCVIVKVSLYKMKRQGMAESVRYGSLNIERKMHDAMVQLDQKLIWIPILFILFRFWGTFRWLLASLYEECNNIDEDCSIIYGHIWFTSTCLDVLYNKFLVYMQSVGDTGQGWANALLYVIFHATIAKRLCPCFFVCGERLSNYFRSWKLSRITYNQIGNGETQERSQLALSVSNSRKGSVDEIPTQQVNKTGNAVKDIIVSPDAASINAMEI